MKSFDEEDEPNISLYPNSTQEEKEQEQTYETCFCVTLVCAIGIIVLFSIALSHTDPQIIDENFEDPSFLKVVSMDFTAELNNSSHGHVPLANARWDLLIRVPGMVVGYYICLQGNLQASFLYKNLTLATSSLQSYKKLETGMPQLLNVSAVATKDDLSGVIGKEIIEAIKGRKEVRFGSRLSLSDCREYTEKGTASFVCNENTLRFEPGSDHIKATSIKNHPTCRPLGGQAPKKKNLMHGYESFLNCAIS